MGAPTILVLIRHGETDANLLGVWHGSTDTPLTATGRRQAELVAEHVRATYPDATTVYASQLERARDTARPIAHALGVELRTDADLAEMQLGEWEGRKFTELHETHRLWHRWAEDPDYAPPGAESVRQVARRASGALRRIADSHPGERVVTVSHGGAINLALGLLLDDSFNAWSRMVSNCSVSELVLEPRAELLLFNHTGHLDHTGRLEDSDS